MKTRYFIELGFHGKNYHGWQEQPNALTVQSVLNSKLSLLLGESIDTVGAGRTDAGVHARQFVAHFDCNLKKSPSEWNDFVNKLNRFLPRDICIFRIVPIHNDAHARYDATARTYRYYISTSKNIFCKDFVWNVSWPLDIGIMNRAAAVIKESTNFTSFSKLHSDVKTNICHIKSAQWVRKDDQLVFIITADRFLRNMVRAIVGTLILFGRNNKDPESIRDIINAKDRCKAGMSAPAQGLFLHKIWFPYDF